MATRRIAGITIELNADTKEFVKGIRDLDKQLGTTQNNLKDINKLLKLNPGNTELLTQKQKNLKSAIEGTKDRLKQLKSAQTDALTPDEYDKLQREIIETQNKLDGLKKEYSDFGSVAKQKMIAMGQSIKDAAGKAAELGKTITTTVGAGAAAALAATTAATVALANAMAGAAQKGYDLAKGAGEYADNLITQSTVTGINTDELQQWGLVSRLIDTDTETMTGSMSKLIKTMGSAAKGSETDAAKFSALGVAIKDSSGRLRNGQDVFYDAIDALGKIENETQRDAMAMDLFGKSAQELNPLIKAGSKQLKSVKDEANKLGGVLSGSSLSALGEFDDSIQKLDFASNGLKQTIGAKLAPVFKPLVDAATKAVSVITSLFKRTENTDYQIKTAVKRIANGFKSALSEVGAIVSEAAPTVLAAVSALLTEVVKQIPDLLQTAMPILATALESLGDLLSYAIPVLVSALPGFVKQILPSVISTVGSIIGGIVDALPDLWEAVKTVFGELWESLKTLIQEKNPELYETLTAIGTFITDELAPALSTAWENVKNTFSEVFGAIKGFWDETLEPVFDAIYDYVIRDLIPTMIVYWEYYLQPAVERVFTAIGTLWDETLKPAFEAIGKFVTDDLAPAFEDFWNGYLVPIYNWISDKFSPLWDGLKDVFEGISSWISDTFSGSWEDAWNGIVDTFGTVFAQIGDLIKAPINAVIDAINWMIDKVEGGLNTIIDGINSHLKITIPSFSIGWPINKSFGGWSWGANLSRVDWGNIEKLATGGVLGEGRQAIVGEYAPERLSVINGRAVVTPLNSPTGGARMGENNSYTFNVYAQPGQSAQQIAQEVQRIMIREHRQRSAAYAQYT